MSSWSRFYPSQPPCAPLSRNWCPISCCNQPQPARSPALRSVGEQHGGGRRCEHGGAQHPGAGAGRGPAQADRHPGHRCGAGLLAGAACRRRLPPPAAVLECCCLACAATRDVLCRPQRAPSQRQLCVAAPCRHGGQRQDHLPAAPQRAPPRVAAPRLHRQPGSGSDARA